MANEKAIAGADASSAQPIVHTIGPGDLRDALAKGLADFEAMPTHVVFLCLGNRGQATDNGRPGRFPQAPFIAANSRHPTVADVIKPAV